MRETAATSYSSRLDQEQPHDDIEVYPGLSLGMCTINKDLINADLLAFIRSESKRWSGDSRKCSRSEWRVVCRKSLLTPEQTTLCSSMVDSWMDPGGKVCTKQLRDAGYSVSVVQNPTNSLADDVAVTRRALAALDGPAILVGHSYGGVVITEAGNDANVGALVYIAAFVPDAGESVAELIKNPAPGAPVPPILPPQDGYLFLDRARFAAAFAADVDVETAAFMADSQVPWGLEALNGAVSQPAWKTKPSWYLVATDDKMIPPDAQRAMAKRSKSTVTEVRGSHSVYVSQPQAVAAIIEKAAKGVMAAAAQ